MINASPFSMFFQSLLPSFSLQQPGGAGAGGVVGQQLQQQQRNREAGEGPANAAVAAVAAAAAAGAGAAAGDGAIAGLQAYTNSLNSIVDAMRDFLSDIRVLERPNDADVDDDDGSEDEDEQNNYLT